ncbi:P1 family peptidase [Phycicoccus endophyticus]|uniref:P1 family peptidase n=1 Tax=Phycicoccus endophyticus TaxID=1690220 RepID=A0A7G9QZ98_9MICO|nr:P1 family peptidase [Phycicoccus endophyticus]NHI19026.1 S58 family peptidase [Phycicoccus endophyticus]QNN48673.1 P1 family peptidase [Phycicoccus endophyticus]GGL32242.1 D-aminopeptidase [Phycicoccus endophyticus]
MPSGPWDAITDVPGVLVGCTTLVEGDDVRTGVTVVRPHDGDIGREPYFAGSDVLNGNGEVTGLAWVRESGMLTTPVAITNTHSVGVVRDAICGLGTLGEDRWSLPVVGETYDGVLNDIGGQHVTAEHLRAAFESAASGPVAQGCVGGGTGMICHGFKGGTGTASRVVPDEDGGFTVGVLVQANHGRRDRLRVEGVDVGSRIGPDVVPVPPRGTPGAGSIVVVVATDAPLLPGQCDRLARRASLGIGRTGGLGEHSSGDFTVAFATGNRGMSSDKGGRHGLTHAVTMLGHDAMNPLFAAVVEATEAAIVGALLAAETMTGRGGTTVHALPHDLLGAALQGGGPPGSA